MTIVFLLEFSLRVRQFCENLTIVENAPVLYKGRFFNHFIELLRLDETVVREVLEVAKFQSDVKIELGQVFDAVGPIFAQNLG